MRYLGRTHGISIQFLFEHMGAACTDTRFNLVYTNTLNMVADIHTKGFSDEKKWKHASELCNVVYAHEYSQTIKNHQTRFMENKQSAESPLKDTLDDSATCAVWLSSTFASDDIVDLAVNRAVTACFSSSMSLDSNPFAAIAAEEATYCQTCGLQDYCRCRDCPCDFCENKSPEVETSDITVAHVSNPGGEPTAIGGVPISVVRNAAIAEQRLRDLAESPQTEDKTAHQAPATPDVEDNPLRGVPENLKSDPKAMIDYIQMCKADAPDSKTWSMLPTFLPDRDN